MPQGPEEREITESLGCTERAGSRFLPHLPAALELCWCAEAVVTCATVISSLVPGLETGDGQGGRAVGPGALEVGRDSRGPTAICEDHQRGVPAQHLLEPPGIVPAKVVAPRALDGDRLSQSPRNRGRLGQH